MEEIRGRLLVNEFVLLAGCHPEQAQQYLKSEDWHFETAISKYFEDTTILANCRTCHTTHPPGKYPLCTPANTPATPPNFSDALMSLSNLSTTDKQVGSSPSVGGLYSSPPNHFGQQPSAGMPMGNSNTTTSNMIVPPTSHFPHNFITGATSPR